MLGRSNQRSMKIIKKDSKTGVVLEEIFFVDGDKVMYELTTSNNTTILKQTPQRNITNFLQQLKGEADAEFNKEFGRGYLEIRGYLDALIEQVVEKTIERIAEGEGWEDSEEHYKKLLLTKIV
jgi:hypothetical protein